MVEPFGPRSYAAIRFRRAVDQLGEDRQLRVINRLVTVEPTATRAGIPDTVGGFLACPRTARLSGRIGKVQGVVALVAHALIQLPNRIGSRSLRDRCIRNQHTVLQINESRLPSKRRPQRDSSREAGFRSTARRRPLTRHIEVQP